MSMLQTVLEYVNRCTPAELDALAERSGISIHTVIKLRNGQTADPRISTLEPLHFVITGGLRRRRGTDNRHPVRRTTDQVLSAGDARRELDEFAGEGS